MDHSARVGRRFTGADGYSTLEILMTVGIMGVLMSMALLQIGQTLPSIKGDGAMRVVIAQVNQAREMAIAQRRNMQLTFTSGNKVEVIRENWPGPTLTVLRSVYLESGAAFNLVSGIPDTPEAFGNSSAVYFGTATTIKFGTDGMLLDQSGNPINGSVFVSLGQQARSFRAVTILGSTGRVRGYRWDGRAWKLV